MRLRRRTPGEGPWPWLAAGCVSVSLLMVLALLLLLGTRGLGHFWPADIERVTLHDGQVFAGVAVREEASAPGQATSEERLYYTANRALDGATWRWVALEDIARRDRPEQLSVIEHGRWGTLIGYIDETASNEQRLVIHTQRGQRTDLPRTGIIEHYRPNAMSWVDKILAWGRGVWHFLSQGPRSANTEGGVWPAIFGTILMVLLMSVVVTPFGVLAAIYLNEIADQGRATRLVRIAVRNLAGVPSIVYGVFGLGVFVYGLGGTLDTLFYSDRLPSPTFGTGGLLWASLTLALLTLPVVIVATEEGLARIPDAQREGALALGATRIEMLRRVVLPMAVPAMLTGVILAIARAAGEVAPLLLVGVAKLAPQVPVDDTFPFLHLERKFMHLGYHILDVGFYSGDVEAAMPLLYATALLLVLVIVVLNLTAIFLRHHVKSRHGALPR
ncbi:phosphate ABC transporter permease PstA [Litchfieldella xinjiangensis]|uniref:phosphate ABC transporter permease PstA n=1 Tax=Litchfieldella xinjiangensis TaxID=1166948 RepID=UPI0005BAC536|nr:phosphate ABC transporter permease PstA [Halomonas xinjiangensis]